MSIRRSLFALILLVAAVLALPAAPSRAQSGGRIAFVDRVDDNTQLFVMNADGSARRQLTSFGGPTMFPSWSPDGSQIVFAADTQKNFPSPSLYIINADGSGLRSLGTCCATGAAWSPDGSKIAFTTFPNHHENRFDIALINPDGSGMQQLTTDGRSGGATWSPDSKRIIFSSNRDNEPNLPFQIPQLYMMNADGTAQTKLAAAGLRPAWSPDGNRLAWYIAFDQATPGGLRMAQADGTGAVDLPTPGTFNAANPAWSPDGARLAFDAFRSMDSLDRYIVTVGLDGNSLTVLGSGSEPAWTNGGGAPPSVPSGQRCFNEPGIGDCIEGRFRDYWEQHGGLPVFGYPISAAAEQQTGEGTFPTQWFERNRFELHAENAAPYDVLLGRLGDDRLRQLGRDWQSFPKASPSDAHYFAETGHAIAHGPFWQYWSSHGLEFDGQAGFSAAESLALFGLPLSEPAMETNAAGDTVLTQWFERARFEDHRAKGVLLGLLGNEVRNAP